MSNADLKPVKIDNTMAFMFESHYFLKATEWSMDDSLVKVDQDYYKVETKIIVKF
jgi:homogentisate 1,2-dioxygenase